jgi:hypothetical protein
MRPTPLLMPLLLADLQLSASSPPPPQVERLLFPIRLRWNIYLLLVEVVEAEELCFRLTLVEVVVVVV